MGPLAMMGAQAGMNLAQNMLGNQYNRKQADLAWKREKKMWQMQNAYNSPLQQMKRFDEAGLNPHLIYGQGNPGNASTMPRYQAARGEFDFMPNLLNTLSQYQSYKNSEAQNRLLDAQTEQVKTNTALTVLKQSDLQNKLELFPDQRLFLRRKSANELSRGNLIFQQAGKTYQEADMLQRYNLNFYDQLLEEKLRQAQTKTESDKMDLLFKNYQKQFEEMGIRSSDHIVLRMLVRMMNEGLPQF